MDEILTIYHVFQDFGIHIIIFWEREVMNDIEDVTSTLLEGWAMRGDTCSQVNGLVSIVRSMAPVSIAM